MNILLPGLSKPTSLNLSSTYLPICQYVYLMNCSKNWTYSSENEDLVPSATLQSDWNSLWTVVAFPTGLSSEEKHNLQKNDMDCRYSSDDTAQKNWSNSGCTPWMRKFIAWWMWGMKTGTNWRSPLLAANGASLFFEQTLSACTTVLHWICHFLQGFLLHNLTNPQYKGKSSSPSIFPCWYLDQAVSEQSQLPNM